MALVRKKSFFLIVLTLLLFIQTAHCDMVSPMHDYIKVDGDNSIPRCLNSAFNSVKTPCDSADELCKLDYFKSNCVYFVENDSTKCSESYNAINVNQIDYCIKLESPLTTKSPLLLSNTRSLSELFMNCDSNIEGNVYAWFRELFVYLLNNNIDFATSSGALFSVYFESLYKEIELRNVFDCIEYNLAEEVVSFVNCDAGEMPLYCESDYSPIITDSLGSNCPISEYSVKYSEFGGYCFVIINRDQRYMKEIYELFEPVSVTRFRIWDELVKKYSLVGSVFLANGEKLGLNGLSLPNEAGILLELPGPTPNYFLIGNSDVSYDYIALQRKVEVLLDPMIYLEGDSSNPNKFQVIVYSEENLQRVPGITCIFYGWQLIYFDPNYVDSFIIEAEDKQKQSITVYEINPIYTTYPRYTACEGLKGTGGPDVAIQSKQIAYDSRSWKSPIFTFYLKLYIDSSRIPRPNEQTDFIDSLLKNVLPNNIKYELILWTFFGIEQLTANTQLNIEEISGVYVYEMKEQETFELMQYLNNTLINISDDTFDFISIKSIKYCFSQLLEDRMHFHWQTVFIGQRAATDENCLNANGLPYTRQCVGDMVVGGEWAEFDYENAECMDKKLLSSITLELFDIERALRNGTASNIKVLNRLLEISLDSDEITSVDLIKIAVIIELTQTIDILSKADKQPNLVPDIINNVMNLEEAIVTVAAQVELNTTNMLLDSLDKGTDLSQPFNDVGVVVQRRTNIIIVRIDPAVRNISGVALYSKSSYAHFDNYKIRFLHLNQSIDELLEDNQLDEEYSLEVATFIPESLYHWFLESNKNNPRPLEILITVFHNDKLFQTNQRSFADKVISIKVHGYRATFPMLLPTVYRRAAEKEADDFCGFFNFRTNNHESTLSEWNERGCFLMQQSIENNLTACGCFHLTHFSFLLSGQKWSWGIDNEAEMERMERHDRTLTWITRIFSGLSLLGIFGVFLTAMVIQQWRHELKNVIILQFAFSIAMQIIIILIADSTVNREKELYECVLLGGSLQYFTLVTFSWMFILALRQYQLFVKVFNTHITSRFFILTVVIGWIVPLIPTIATAVFSPDSYTPSEDTNICYPKDTALRLGLILPISIVVGFNLSIYVIVIHSISLNTIQTKSVPKYELVQFRMAIFMFFFLGLTWIFGLLSTVATFSTSIQLTLSYLFNLTATLQGFILFIFYIVLNPSTRKLWLKKINDKILSISSEHTN